MKKDQNFLDELFLPDDQIIGFLRFTRNLHNSVATGQGFAALKNRNYLERSQASPIDLKARLQHEPIDFVIVSLIYIHSIPP